MFAPFGEDSVSPNFPHAKETCSRLLQSSSSILKTSQTAAGSSVLILNARAAAGAPFSTFNQHAAADALLLFFNVRAARARRFEVFTNLSFPAQSCTSLAVDHVDLGLLRPTAQSMCSFVAARLTAQPARRRWSCRCLRTTPGRHRAKARFVKLASSALSAESFPASLVSSPASSPALSPAFYLVA